jgi:hypothetical protein
MEQVELENMLYSILYGTYYVTYNNVRYSCVPNTLQDKYEASIIYKQIMHDMKYEEMLTWEEAQRLSELTGKWTNQDEAGLKDLDKMVENTKLQMYLNYTNPMSVDKLRKKLKQVQNGIVRSNQTKYKLYHATKESHAENIRAEFLIAMSFRDNCGNRLYNIDSFWDCNNSLIQAAIEEKPIFAMDKIRKIARQEPWRSMWIAHKGDTIGKPSVEWTEHQRILCSFSKMYDNVYESTECPPDEVINDDDVLDGWFIKQRKDREEAKQEKSTDHHFGNHKGKGRQELFVMARNQDEVNSILNQNDASGKAVIETRKQVIKNAGGEAVKEQEMPDVRRDLQMQAVQEMREKFRR